MNLSAHFTVEEFTASEMAARNGIDNSLPAAWHPSAISLCERVLEPARAALGPLRINSGYRCAALNTLIGGAWGSQHQFGQAADIIPLAPGVTLFQLFERIVKSVTFDQVIWEFGAWVHVSYSTVPRGGILVASRMPGKKRAAYREITSDQLSTLL